MMSDFIGLTLDTMSRYARLSAAVLALSTLLACNFTGYEQGQQRPHQPSAGQDPSAAQTFPDAESVADDDVEVIDQSGSVAEAVAVDDASISTAGDANEQSFQETTRTAERSELDVGNTSADAAGACPQLPISRLIVEAQYDEAKAVLDEQLERGGDEIERSCILSTMGLLSALPNSSLYNPQQALDYQSLARVNGAVRRGSLQLQMLDRTVTGMLASYQQSSAVDTTEVQSLREELRKKEEALERLKELTLGSD